MICKGGTAFSPFQVPPVAQGMGNAETRGRRWLPRDTLASRAQCGQNTRPNPQFLNRLGKNKREALRACGSFLCISSVSRGSLGQALMCATKAVFLDLQVD